MAKILLISSKESDYLQDLLRAGLVQVLGKKNVVDLPWNLAFHWPARAYPRDLGYTGFDFFSCFRNLKINFKDYDLVIVGAVKPDCFEAYLKVVKDIPASTPVVLLDGGDRSDIGGDLDRLGRPELWDQALSFRPFQWVFKREYLLHVEHPAFVQPLPFSFDFARWTQRSWPRDKKYQVSFWGVESDPVRTRALTLLEGHFDCAKNGTVRNQVFRKYHRKGRFYLEELARCQVVLNFRGVGWDTLRYWEAPGVAGFMISQRPKIRIPDNFHHEKEVIFCRDDLSDLIGLCEYYLKNEKQRNEIAQRAFALAKEKHSALARARTLLQVVGL